MAITPAIRTGPSAPVAPQGQPEALPAQPASPTLSRSSSNASTAQSYTSAHEFLTPRAQDGLRATGSQSAAPRLARLPSGPLAERSSLPVVALSRTDSTESLGTQASSLSRRGSIDSQGSDSTRYTPARESISEAAARAPARRGRDPAAGCIDRAHSAS